MLLFRSANRKLIPMAHIVRRFVLSLSVFAFALSGPPLPASSLGDFFKSVGRSISHLGRSPTPTPTPRKSRATGRENGPREKNEKLPSPTPTPFMTPTPTPMEIRPATSAPRDRRRSRDLPYGVAVPNRPGLVTSPYAPNEGYVDVRAFPSSTEVMDPFTGKIFLTP
jgi:hypothetical protein